MMKKRYFFVDEERKDEMADRGCLVLIGTSVNTDFAGQVPA